MPAAAVHGLHNLLVLALFASTALLFLLGLAVKPRSARDRAVARYALSVSRDGRPYLSVSLDRARYSVGRGPACDIRLKGEGVPLAAGDIIMRNGRLYFRPGDASDGDARAERPLDDAQPLLLNNYTLTFGEAEG